MYRIDWENELWSPYMVFDSSAPPLPHKLAFRIKLCLRSDSSHDKSKNLLRWRGDLMEIVFFPQLVCFFSK